MMFINIVRCDLNNGILKKWKFYLFTGAFFSILAIFAYFDFDAALRMTPSPITADITVGDYLCFLFGGTSAGNLPIELIDKNNIVNSMFKFSFPSIWILIYLILLLLTLEYPYEDLMGFGKNIIILSNKIQYWWISKCIWIAASVFVYFTIALTCFSVTAIMLGAKASFEIGTYYPYFRFNSYDFVTEPPYTLIFVLAGAAARIAYVNITAEKPIIEYYSENEWAGLNGSYIRSWEENTEGYSVKIVGYEVMEKEKYFSKYDLSGKDQSVADPFAYIMEVTIKIKNEENETGKLQIADWALIGKNDDFIAYLDQQLLMDTDERVNGVLSSISTASGKEIEIKLPYPLIYMDKEKEIDRNMPYKIAVTKYPSRKYIQFG